MSADSTLREEFEDGIWIGEWYIEPMRNRVSLEDEEVQLEPKVMEVLLCLARRPGKTVTKDEFMDRVWRDTIVTDDVLSRCISQLRKVFDDDPKDPSYIETIRKTGYRLVAPVERPNTEEGTEPEPEDDDHPTAVEDGPFIGDPIGRVAEFAKASIPTALWTRTLGRLSAGTQGYVLIGAIVLLLVFAVTWAVSGGRSTSNGPVSAVPFTSFAGEELEPALSNVGHKMAFAWRRPDSPHQNIYLMQRGAEQPLQLSPDTTEDWSPTWSPDGRFVAYVHQNSGTHRIAIVPSIGGHPSHSIALSDRDIQSVAWMPDTTGRRLVVSVQRRPHQAHGLALHDPDTDSLVSLTKPPLWSTGDVDPVPSPDGSRIAFVRGTVQGVQDIFVVPTSSGTPTQVTTDSTVVDGVAWSADGTELFYAAERDGLSGLWRVRVDGGSPRLIKSASAGTRFSHPSVSGESNRLVYTQKSEQLDIWKLSRPNQYEDFSTRPLLSSTQDDVHPSIGPRGKRIAFVSDRSGTSEIWTAQADGSNPNRLTALGGPTVTTIRWSPAGDRLCFVARQNGQSDLHLLPASGGEPTRLTTAPSEDLVPRWSHDGRWVYFSSNRTGAWEAWRTRTSGDSLRVQQVTTGGAVAAQESPIDSTLYFIRPDQVGIWDVTLNTNRLPIETGVESSSFPINVIGQFNPQGRGSWWVGENGIHFVHEQSTSAVLAYHEFASGRIIPLHQFPDWRPVQSVDVAPNGTWFAYTHVVDKESDVMLVENFR